MGRIMCIDPGLKRTGIAVTDPMQIIATGLTTIPPADLIPFLTKYLLSEQVEKILVGYPLNLDGSETHGTALVKQLLPKLQKAFPNINIETIDERFSSRFAKQAMLEMGLKKKDRRNKGLVDEIAAAMLLQEYLQWRST